MSDGQQMLAHLLRQLLPTFAANSEPLAERIVQEMGRHGYSFVYDAGFTEHQINQAVADFRRREPLPPSAPPRPPELLNVPPVGGHP